LGSALPVDAGSALGARSLTVTQRWIAAVGLDMDEALPSPPCIMGHSDHSDPVLRAATPGQLLPDGIRDPFERTFGADLDGTYESCHATGFANAITPTIARLTKGGR
jgi:hypothetical protein